MFFYVYLNFDDGMMGLDKIGLDIIKAGQVLTVNMVSSDVVVVVGAAYNHIHRITLQSHCTIDTVISNATVTIHFD